MNNFLKVDKELFNKGLKSVDILILAQIEEYDTNGRQCYVTNQQFAEMFGESVSTIKRSIAKLEQAGWINKETHFVGGNGRSNRQRLLTLANGRVNMNPPTTMEGSNRTDHNIMEGSNVDDGRFKNDEWKVHNEPIKDNIKNNKKDNYCATAQADAKGASSAPAQDEKAINALQQWMGADSATATKYHSKIHKELTNNDIIRFLANTNKTAKDYQAQRKFGIDDFAAWFCEQAYKQAGLPG